MFSIKPDQNRTLTKSTSTSQVPILNLLDKCTTILKNDRLTLRNLIKNGEQEPLQIIQKFKKGDLKVLQIELRKYLNRYKGKQNDCQAPQQTQFDNQFNESGKQSTGQFKSYFTSTSDNEYVKKPLTTANQRLQNSYRITSSAHSPAISKQNPTHRQKSPNPNYSEFYKNISPNPEYHKSMENPRSNKHLQNSINFAVKSNSKDKNTQKTLSKSREKRQKSRELTINQKLNAQFEKSQNKQKNQPIQDLKEEIKSESEQEVQNFNEQLQNYIQQQENSLEEEYRQFQLEQEKKNQQQEEMQSPMFKMAQSQQQSQQYQQQKNKDDKDNVKIHTQTTDTRNPQTEQSEKINGYDSEYFQRYQQIVNSYRPTLQQEQKQQSPQQQLEQEEEEEVQQEDQEVYEEPEQPFSQQNLAGMVQDEEIEDQLEEQENIQRTYSQNNGYVCNPKEQIVVKHFPLDSSPEKSEAQEKSSDKSPINHQKFKNLQFLPFQRIEKRFSNKNELVTPLNHPIKVTSHVLKSPHKEQSSEEKEFQDTVLENGTLDIHKHFSFKSEEIVSPVTPIPNVFAQIQLNKQVSQISNDVTTPFNHPIKVRSNIQYSPKKREQMDTFTEIDQEIDQEEQDQSFDNIQIKRILSYQSNTSELQTPLNHPIQVNKEVLQCPFKKRMLEIQEEDEHLQTQNSLKNSQHENFQVRVATSIIDTSNYSSNNSQIQSIVNHSNFQSKKDLEVPSNSAKKVIDTNILAKRYASKAFKQEENIFTDWDLLLGKYGIQRTESQLDNIGKPKNNEEFPNSIQRYNIGSTSQKYLKDKNVFENLQSVEYDQIESKIYNGESKIFEENTQDNKKVQNEEQILINVVKELNLQKLLAEDIIDEIFSENSAKILSKAFFRFKFEQIMHDNDIGFNSDLVEQFFELSGLNGAGFINLSEAGKIVVQFCPHKTQHNMSLTIFHFIQEQKNSVEQEQISLNDFTQFLLEQCEDEDYHENLRSVAVNIFTVDGKIKQQFTYWELYLRRNIKEFKQIQEMLNESD